MKALLDNLFSLSCLFISTCRQGCDPIAKHQKLTVLVSINKSVGEERPKTLSANILNSVMVGSKKEQKENMSTEVSNIYFTYRCLVKYWQKIIASFNVGEKT